MRIDLKSFRMLSGLMIAGCLFSACGGDEEGDDDASAGQGGSAGSSGGSKASGAGKGGGSGKGGATSGGSTSTGGTNSSGGGAGESTSAGGAFSEAGSGGEGNASAGGADDGSGGTAGAPSNPAFDGCEVPEPSLEYCYAENDDRPGTAVCSEYYVAGAAQLFCESPQPGGCPRDSELEGICAGGITSSYYYADPSNEGFWDATEPGCEINGGTWCSD